MENRKSGIVDFLELGANAFVSGLVAAIALSVIALALFTTAIAHIGAKERVQVTIEYQQALVYDGGRYRLRFPLAVTPRYVASAADVSAIPDVPKTDEALGDDGAVVNPAYGDGCGGPTNAVDIAVVIDSGVPIDGVVSSYHDIQVEKESGNRT